MCVAWSMIRRCVENLLLSLSPQPAYTPTNTQQSRIVLAAVIQALLLKLLIILGCWTVTRGRICLGLHQRLLSSVGLFSVLTTADSQHAHADNGQRRSFVFLPSRFHHHYFSVDGPSQLCWMMLFSTQVWNGNAPLHSVMRNCERCFWVCLRGTVCACTLMGVSYGHIYFLSQIFSEMLFIGDIQKRKRYSLCLYDIMETKGWTDMQPPSSVSTRLNQLNANKSLVC